MPPKNRALGRGLDALLPAKNEKITEVAPNSAPDAIVTSLPLNRIIRNDKQPRETFNNERLSELAASIRVHGLIQPLAVVVREDKYMLVAGERRWRAAQIVGLTEVPVIVLDTLSDQDLLECALVENLQRENLNPMEEARAYRSLLETFKISMDEIALRVGKGRSSVSNALRLLSLPDAVALAVQEKRISAGHAKAILSLASVDDQLKLYEIIWREDLSVRQAEQRAVTLGMSGGGRKGERKQAARSAPLNAPDIKKLREQLVEALSCKVEIRTSGPDSGRVEIYYESLDELQRFLNRISSDF